MKNASEFTSVSYRQFGQDLCALANTLIERGLAGKAIAVVGENSYDWVLTYLSVVNINATIVPIDKELSKEDMRELLVRAKVGAFFYSATFEEESAYIKTHIPGMMTVSFGDKGGADYTMTGLISEGEQLVAQGKDRYSGIEIDRERTCAVLFTSGTTGKSKGVMLSHHNLASNIVGIVQIVHMSPEDVLLSVLPIHHTLEVTVGILAPMAWGVTFAFCESVKKLPACMKLFRPTVMTLVPLYVETFHKKIWESAKKHGKEAKLRFGIGLGNVLAAVGIDVRRKLMAEVLESFGGRVRIMPCGGAPLSPEVMKCFVGLGIRVYQGYGTTECSPIVSANSDHYYRVGSDGYILACNEVRISDTGEILVRGENVMKGYLDDEKATDEAFDGEWYKTGDLGFLKDGFLYVTGRCKNLIVLKNGKNISPEEIEIKLSVIPSVAEVIVKEDSGNEYLTAEIYPDQEALRAKGEETLKKEIGEEVERLNQKLEAYRRVRRITLRKTEFPKTTKRSIVRYQV
jgi:long-chain acyl-CoA synthetase